ncbi:hypothetical protein D3C86_1791550 [compost metagenome]
MATPAIFTEMKKLTQCPASNKPLSNSRRTSTASSFCQRVLLAKRANNASANTANAARPNTMIAGDAAASLPNTPVRPNISAPICKAPRAVRGVMAILEKCVKRDRQTPSSCSSWRSLRSTAKRS